MSDEEGKYTNFKIDFFLGKQRFLGVIALDEDGIIRMPDTSFEPNPQGLGNELFRVMMKNRDRIAQVC